MRLIHSYHLDWGTQKLCDQDHGLWTEPDWFWMPGLSLTSLVAFSMTFMPSVLSFLNCPVARVTGLTLWDCYEELNLSTPLSIHHTCPGLYEAWEQLRSLQFSVDDKLTVRSQRTWQYTPNKCLAREETCKTDRKARSSPEKVAAWAKCCWEKKTGLRTAEKRVVST